MSVSVEGEGQTSVGQERGHDDGPAARHTAPRRWHWGYTEPGAGVRPPAISTSSPPPSLHDTRYTIWYMVHIIVYGMLLGCELTPAILYGYLVSLSQ